MNSKLLPVVLVLLALTGCAHSPTPVEPTPRVEITSSAPLAIRPPALPPLDPTILSRAEANLRVLGYPVSKKNAGPADPAFQHALIAFEHDQGLAEESVLSPAVTERLIALRAELQSVSVPARNGMFIYSGSLSHQAVFLATPPSGYSSDATAKFLMPLHPGAQATMHLIRKGSAPMAITCSVGRLTSSKLPLAGYVLPIDCHGDSPQTPRWLDLYSPRLGMVVQQQTASGLHDLIAIRPNTINWPVAARSGLDWALSSALDAPGSAPIEWSSTGVAPHFEIKAWGRLDGGDLGLGEDLASTLCRRFELTESGANTSYPGVACQTVGGTWALPSSRTLIARPGGQPARTAVSLRSTGN